MRTRGRGAMVTWMASAVLFLGCAQEPPPPALLRVETEPVTGATVALWGETQPGATPLSIPVELTEPATVPIWVTKDGYQRVATSEDLAPGEAKTVTVELERLVGYLTVDTDPPEARFFLDGEFRGTTPIHDLAVPPGDYVYTLRLAGHEPVLGRVTVSAWQSHHRSHVLEGGPGILRVFSMPDGATIWLNHDKQKQKTPAELVAPAGEYVIDVHVPGHVQTEGRVTLAPGGVESVRLSMPPGDVPVGMVLIPAGPFIMGEDMRSPDEAPRRTVDVPAFYMDKYEVTNEDFRAVFKGHRFAAGLEHFPVTGVNWHQANEYAKAVDKRLPTEAEWEKAARGADGRNYPWGASFDPAVCNALESGLGAVTAVGAARGGLSPHGCADMAGNALEWTGGWYEVYPGNERIEKEYGHVYRVLRGGSYQTQAFDVRCARRLYGRPDEARADYGFRCAKDVSE